MANAMAASVRVKTRSTVICCVFVVPKELNDYLLPTYADMMMFYLWVKHDLNIASVVLQYVAIISKDDSSNVIDRMKVRRERSQQRSQLQNKFFDESLFLQGPVF